MPLQISVFIYRFKSKNGCGVNQNTLFCFILLNMKPYRYAPRNTGGKNSEVETPAVPQPQLHQSKS